MRTIIFCMEMLCTTKSYPIQRKVDPPEDVHPRPDGHGRRDSHHSLILGGDIDDRVGKYEGEVHYRQLAFNLTFHYQVELGDPMHAIGGALLWRVSHPLGGLDV